MNTLELLSTEEAVVLPEREALSFLSFNFARVRATNVAVSSQTLTAFSSSSANAGQTVVVIQA